jgi:hypothetical protein
MSLVSVGIVMGLTLQTAAKVEQSEGKVHRWRRHSKSEARNPEQIQKSLSTLSGLT